MLTGPQQAVLVVTRQYRPRRYPKGGLWRFRQWQRPQQNETPKLKVRRWQAPRYTQTYSFFMKQDPSARPRVPNLLFNSHIYSESPSARRVMINNIYLREGQQFLGMEVVEIGEFNIVFKKDGVLFKLPAMRDWNG